MIPLRFSVELPPIVEPLIFRLREKGLNDLTVHDAILVNDDGVRREYDYNGFSISINVAGDDSLDRDVFMALPGQASAHRLIRAQSRHNTFLVTERCDQLCLMCSQPPKKHHTDFFGQFALAASLAPPNTTIGISGGEPLLFKARLFEMLEIVYAQRPDIRYHVLTNAQHLTWEDVAFLSSETGRQVLWGVPLYSASSEVHDGIVKKEGAFRYLVDGLRIFIRSGSAVELRTVIMRENVEQLDELTQFISTRLSFIAVWALMQLEPIGYARMNWRALFEDTSLSFDHISKAIDIMSALGKDVALYNFPLCSMPPQYRKFAPPSISDWKQKYLGFCSTCNARSTCGGFFEWYNHQEGFARLGPI